MTAGARQDAGARRYPNLVGGEWRGAKAERWLAVHDPADRRQVVGEVPAMGAGDVAEVYDHAAAAAPGWAATSPIVRGRILLKASRLLRERRDDIAHDLTREMGKTLAEALAEVEKSADFFEYYSAVGRLGQGQVLAHERADARAWTVREPLGVVLAVTPWNDPLLTPARKLAPALAVGNAVMLKAASYTPIVGHHLARALADAGLPAGVVGTITGSTREIGDALIDHSALRAVSFTGSNAVGEQLRRNLAAGSVKLLAELGGKNAVVVLADADLDLAAGAIATAAFAQAGQRCTAASRLIVERPVLPELLDRLAVAAARLVAGPGLDPRTTFGPLVADEQRDTVAGYVAGATAQGAETIAGGRIPEAAELAYGSYFEPTILTAVATEMDVWREEVFGPVIATLAVDDLDAAIAEVNSSVYGLAAAIFTADLAAADRFAAAADVGQVAVNLPTSGWDVHMPFGGFKASGSGHKEQGEEGLSFYSRTKTIVSNQGKSR